MIVRGVTLGTILLIMAIAIFMNHKTYNDYTPSSNYQENINTNYTDTQKKVNYIDFSNIPPPKNNTKKEIAPNNTNHINPTNKIQTQIKDNKNEIQQKIKYNNLKPAAPISF